MNPSKHYLSTIIVISALIAGAMFVWLMPPSPARCVAFGGGTILTMEDETPEVEALLVQGSRIVAYGSSAEIMNQSRDCELYDLQGRTLMPGLIEPHTHPIAAALLSQAIDVSGFTHNSRAEVMRSLKRGIANDKQGPIIAFGWDPVMIKGLTPPTLAELDALSPHRPLLILTQMMHDAYVNSAALAAAGLHRNTPDPLGGELVRDENGDLTGALREVSAINLLMAATPKAPIEALELLLNRQYATYAKVGYTTVGALGPRATVDDALYFMHDLGSMDDPVLQTIVYALPEQLQHNGWKVGTSTTNGAFVLRGVKLWMDGSPFTGGAALSEPYEDTPLTREGLQLTAPHKGKLNFTQKEFTDQFRKFHEAGYQIAVHTQGERAIDRVLDAAEEVFEYSPRPGHRHRLEHAAFITEAQIKRAKKLGFTISFFIDHIYFYGHRLPQLIGDERTWRYLPMGQAAKAGHTVTFHTDSPAMPPHPFRALYAAVTRQPREGGAPINMDNALTRQEALKAMTINAAWQLALEHEIGTLSPGKRADLVIMRGDPMRLPADQLMDIRVEETWINGRKTDMRVSTIKNAQLIFRLFWKQLF